MAVGYLDNSAFSEDGPYSRPAPSGSGISALRARLDS